MINNISNLKFMPLQIFLISSRSALRTLNTKSDYKKKGGNRWETVNEKNNGGFDLNGSLKVVIWVNWGNLEPNIFHLLLAKFYISKKNSKGPDCTVEVTYITINYSCFRNFSFIF